MKKGRLVPGMILVLVGTYMLLNQLFNLPDGIFLVFVGGALLFLRGVTKSYGFTIAGSIVMMLGFCGIVEELSFFPESLVNSAQLILLAMAFFIIHMIDYRRIGNWPLVPGICLLGVAAFVFLDENLIVAWNVRELLRKFWPVGLICVGAAMVGGAFMRRPRDKNQRNEDVE